MQYEYLLDIAYCIALPLEHLDLTGFLNVTDDGAEHIAEMKHLRYLSLDGTKVTDAGVELLRSRIKKFFSSPFFFVTNTYVLLLLL